MNVRTFWKDNISLSKPLPADHIRIDLLYADDCRRMNAGLYSPVGSPPYEYLLAMQLALEWTDTDAGAWAGGSCDGVGGGATFSQRPCYNTEPRAGTHHTHHKSNNKSKESSRVSAYFRRSMVRGDDNIAIISRMLKKQLRLESMSGEERLEGLEDILTRVDETMESSSSEEESEVSDYANISSSDDEEFDESSDEDSGEDYSVEYSDEVDTRYARGTPSFYYSHTYFTIITLIPPPLFSLSNHILSTLIPLL